MKKYLITFLLMLPLAVMAQTKNCTVKGLVADAASGEPLQSASLQLFQLPDSTFKAGTATDYEGRFSISAPAANYFLRVSYVGYNTIDKSVKVEEGKVLDLGKIELSVDAVMLDAANITAEVPPVTANGDTLVFNTAAFRVAEGSMLEELISKYPGVEIDEDGTIKINGKTVSRILMKGKDFFGNDKDMALKNLSADAIDKVKFYDKKSDFARVTGIDDGEEETVLDLQLKKGVADGLFSNTDIGYGTKERYMFRNTTGYFNDNAQYTLILGANNVGNQGFDGGGRGQRRGNSGLTAPKQAGFNFAYGGNKIELGGNVRVNHRDTDSKNWRSSETFMPQLGRNQFSNSRSRSLGRSSNLNADFRLEWKPDTMTDVILRPSVGYSTSDSWNESVSAAFNDDPFNYADDYSKNFYGDVFAGMDSVAINSNRNESMSMNENFNANADLMVNRRLNKPGRNITFRGHFSYSDSKSESFSLNNVKYYQASAGTPGYDRQRYSSTPGKSWSYDLRLSYTEPLTRNLFLQLSYNYNYSYSNSDRATYVLDSIPDYLMLLNADYKRPLLPEEIQQYRDEDLSRYSNYRTQRHEIQLSVRYVTDKMNLNAGIGWMPQHTELDQRYLGMDTVVSRNVYNITPSLRFQYKWSKSTNLNIMYRGRTNHPSLTDLMDITDDSNPLNITKGNPNLKPSFSNNVNANFNTYNTDAQRGFNVFVGFSNTLNSISRKATYDEATGATTTQPDNINGNWNANAGLSFNSAIPANKKYTFSTTTNFGYTNNVSYISVQNKGSVKSKARTFNVFERLVGNYRTDNFDISITGNLRYSHSSSSAQPEDKMNVFDFSYGPSVNYTFPWQNLKVSTNISMSSRRGYSDPNANTDELLWNAQVSASFLNRNALSVIFMVNDILQQQSNISRVVDALSRRDSETNAIYSYCMLTLSYKFNNTGGKDGNSKGRGMRGYGMPQQSGFGGPGRGMPGRF